MKLVTRILTRAGYAVIACGTGALSTCIRVGPPDVVLLAETMAPRLRALAITLWPNVPVVVWDGSGRPSDLRAMVDSAVTKPQNKRV